MLTKIQSDLDTISGFDPEMWNLLRNKKIFATGCTGFIGTWIIYSFVHFNQKFNLNAELICLTRNKNKNEEKFQGVKFVEGDIESFPFPSGEFDFIIHGATEVASYQQGSDQSSLLDISYLGTKRVQSFAKQAKAQKILFLSSGAAYGTQPLNLQLLEESFGGAPDVTQSKSTYGEAKRLGELLLFNDSIPSTSARIFATCGPFLPNESKFAFSNFLNSVVSDSKIIIQSNGKTTRSYLYIGDVTLWLWLLLLKGKDKEIYNVGSDDEISISELAKKIKTTLNSEVEIEVQGKEPGFNRYIPSNKKIRQEFRITNMVPLDVGIKKSYEFLKVNDAI
jgi:nucleoside-diphosphate-sugar epimerase